MKIFPPTIKGSRNELLTFLSGIIASGTVWVSHYYLEYIIPIRLGLDLWFVILPYFTIPFGVVFTLAVVRNWNHYISFLFFVSLYILSFMFTLLINQELGVWIGFSLAGFSIGTFFGIMYVQLDVMATRDAQFNGRTHSLGYLIFGVMVIVTVLSLMIGNLLLISLLLLFFLLLVNISTIIGKEEGLIHDQKKIDVRRYIQKKENIPGFTVSFLVGFFVTIPQYATTLILEYYITAFPERYTYNLAEAYSIFVIILWGTVIILAFMGGLLLDIVGRKLGILLGLGIQALAFVLLSIDVSETLLVFLFPVIIGIGSTTSIIGFYLMMFELTPREYMRDITSINYLFLAFGMASAVIIGKVLGSFFILQPANLSIILLFIFVIVTIVVSQIRETLPSRDELEWKESVQYLTVLFKSGLPIFNQDLGELQQIKKGTQEELLGGALVAISALLKEVAQDEKPLKVVRKEGFTIIIEEGESIIVAVITTKELNAIRKKTKNFLEEFENLFGEFIEQGIANTQLFLPAKRLVEKHFR